jgi:hypothetical protein
MKRIQYTTSPGIPHQSMDEEFLCHKKGPEWWYSTGYMFDEAGKLFSYQFTLAKIRVYGIKFNILITALTDFETGRHYYTQESIFFEKNVIITPNQVGIAGRAEMTFEKEGIELDMSGENYSFSAALSAAKPRVWHCDQGTLKMGIDQNWTYYWSYTNLDLSGRLVLDGREHQVKGKGWFDKQGGPYNLADRRTQWEWFSMRFFDNEEIMLFSFPHDSYQDGTYIEESGRSRRLNDYQIEPLGWTEARGLKFSLGWKVHLNGIKAQDYVLVPIIDGQFNFLFFELLAEIRDGAGKQVGYCFVELLPGVYNEKNTLKAAFARTSS